MNTRLVLLVLALFVAVAYVYAHEGDSDEGGNMENVLSLNKANFRSQLATLGSFFVMFYAPWCGHCKRLKPIWDEAAVSLKDSITIAKVDCTVDQDLCQEYQIEGFPTLKFFTSTGVIVDYSGDRTLADITRFATKVTRPSLSIITSADELKAFTMGQPVAFVFVGDELTKAKAESIASNLVASHSMAYISDADKSIVADYTTVTPALILLADDDKQALAGEDMTEEAVSKFLVENQFGLLPELTPTIFTEIQKTKKPITMIAVKPNEAHKDTAFEIARPVARKFKDAFAFTWINAERWGQYLSTHYSIHDDDLPVAVILDHVANKFYKIRITDEQSLTDFFAGVKDGSVKPTSLNPDDNLTPIQQYKKQVEDYIKAFPLFVTISALFIGFILGKIPLSRRKKVTKPKEEKRD